MPNHCYNRVTFYSDDKEKEIKKLHDIFSIDVQAEDEERTIFGQFIPEPDWNNTPLTAETAGNWLHDKRGEVGELPVPVKEYGISYRFKSTDKADDRWYDWRLANWDTKWDAYDVEVTDDDPECTEIEFNTAWSPPEAICSALREQYPDVSISWFYDEPGCEIAGYL